MFNFFSSNSRTAKPGGRVATLVAAALFVMVPFLSLANGAPAALADTLSLDANMTSAWQRTDLPVIQGAVSRSWLWGPSANHIAIEDYADAPGGKRLVAYYDKSRMEINNPQGNRNEKWFVTNGLLVKELISGQRQDGDNKFTNLLPSDVPLAGDPDGNPGPSYNTFLGVSTIDPTQNRASDRTNQSVTATLAKDGSVGDSLEYAKYSVTNAYYNTDLGHNVPKPFWNFMNSQGKVYVNGAYTTGDVVDWTFSTGFPLSEAYWSQVRVAGKTVPVLIQAFQRRVLTYTPSNSAGFQVEMGNVGAHYYKWRYENQLPICQFAPVSGFGKVWADNYKVQAQIGCPYYTEEGLSVTYETFQHGTMYQLDLSKLSHYYYPLYNYGNYSRKVIVVVFDDGTKSWASVSDDWTPAQPVNGSLTPPTGLFEPQNGIGKAWRDGTGLHLRDRLGWATAPEKTTNAALENFYHGNMFFVGGDLKLIYALYGGYSQQSTWDVFADTNTGTGQ